MTHELAAYKEDIQKMKKHIQEEKEVTLVKLSTIMLTVCQSLYTFKTTNLSELLRNTVYLFYEQLNEQKHSQK